MNLRSPQARRAGLVTALLAAMAAVIPLTSATAAETLLSQGMPVVASSIEGAGTPAAAAVDGNAGTRWASQFSDPQWIRVDLGATATISRVVLQWEAAYATAFQIQTSADGSTNWQTIYSTTTGTGGTQNLTVSGSGRYVRMYGTARVGGYGYSLWEFQVYGTIGTTPPSCGTANAALNRPATASSTENAGANGAGAAVDGNAGTRWSSLFSDPQWISVDLGTSQPVCQVVLQWEAAYATAFQIQTSADGSTNWQTIYSTATGTGGTQTLNVSGTGRFVRMYGTARATGYGYSLWEFRIFTGGGPSTSPSASPSPSPSPSQSGNWTTVWNEDFTGTASTSPAAANWLLRTGTQYPGGAANWGTGEVETASASTANVYLDGSGRLNIKAIRDGAGAWTSGRIETQRTDFAANAGEMVRFSAVIQQPNVANGLGYWPAFRATGAAYRGNYNNWPGVGETDIMSGVNGRSQLAQTLHCGTAPDGVCGEYNGRSSGLATCAGCQTGLHEYAQIIDRTKTDEEIRFYLDGVQTWLVKESQVGVAAWDAAVHHGFYLRLELPIGGAYPSAIAGQPVPTSGTTSGGVMIVDKVTVARQAGSTAPVMTDPATPAGPSVVRVTGTQGNWQLQVNGANWEVRGLTYGPPQGAADGYMRDLKAGGVNTIRTWGVDDANTPALLNKAAQQGLKVIVGHWLNQGADYVNDTAYKTSVKTEIVNRVNALKNNQGVLMWDVGNEVILTMQDHGLPAAEVEARRVAYAKFVNEVAVAIHAADPNHPVTSTDAWTGAWPYYKQYSPALDLLAVNSYGAVGGVKQAWIDGGYTKPYILTEGGPAGEWEVPDDVNGVPTEPTDLQKRDGYTASWNALKGHPGVALGGTEFHYGLENDFGGVWLNTFTGGWHRLGYYALQKAYTGVTAANTPPEITGMTVSNQTAVPAGSTFTVNVTATDPQGDAIRYNLMYSNKHITGGTGLTNVRFTQSGNSFTVTAPEQLGVWKIYVYAYDGHGNVGIEQRSIKVVPPAIPGTNVALGKTATASTYQPTGTNGPQLPSYAVDGNWSTRWASEWLATAWIQVDLGAVTAINHVELGWEAAYARSYQIQTSNDGTNWSTVYSTASGDGGFDEINLNVSARYVRMNGTERATTYGYSLWEFGVYKP
jgi:F5/8 type C domain